MTDCAQTLGDFAGGTSVIVPTLIVFALMLIGYWFFTTEEW